MRCLLCVILLLWGSALVARASPVAPCYKECDVRLISEEEDFDVSCNETCKVEKCHDGCNLFTSAISSSCHEVCEEDKKFFKSLYCVIGCNIAINIYMKKIEAEIGIPAKPYLVAETRTNVSIAVKWAPSPYENISFLIQLRYNNVHEVTDWEYYKPKNLLKDPFLNVEDLHPYTKYRFRVAYILLENYPPVFSEESITISTLPYGAPSTPPIITCLTAVSCTRISVSWDPPPLPNGPILSYVLYIKELPFGLTMIKDISDTSPSDGSHHMINNYMINNLKPTTTYRISLSTRNSMGEGPQDVRNITTLSKKEITSSQNTPAYLVFGTKHSILQQGLRILDLSHTLYKLENDSLLVTGVALHVRRSTLFLTDSSGNLHSVNMKGLRQSNIILSSSYKPTTLSMDYLNDKLYMIEEKQIARCDLTGSNYEVILSNMKYRAADLNVDPLNGYMYVTMGDHLLEGGLYRIDLIEFFHSGKNIKFEERTQLIVSDSYLTAFVVDYKNFRILLPTNNTVVSVSLDGSDVSDIRDNSQTPLYKNIRSIAVYEDLLYWATDTLIYREEHYKREDKYYQNVYSVGEGPFLALNIYHTEYQPLPSPLNPVESIEALFDVNVAKISWNIPRVLGGQGKGSWKNWMYEVQIKSNSSSTIVKNINENMYNISNLQPNTRYAVKVRPYSNGGKGPWSGEFNGITLQKSETSGFPYIMYGGREGLLKSDFVGDNVENLIHKININNAYITNLCWYETLIFINTNTTFLYIYNDAMTPPSLTRLPNITMSTSIAIDYLAPKLYWSSPAKQLISRSNLDGSQPEPLPILTMAKQIAIDSINGHLYWATSHSVERSYLNGMEHFVYMKNALFSGKHVMGLTLDFDMEKVYWMVRSFEGSIIYRACLAKINDSSCNPEKPDVVGSLSEDGLHGPVSYFNNKLFWLHESERAFVSDIKGTNFARLYGKGLHGLTTMEIIDPSMHKYPNGFSKTNIKVVPPSISEHAIRIVGTYDRFNVTWDPIRTVNYATVFYEIRVDDGDEFYSLITNETVFVYPTMKRLRPFTPLTISMLAFTHWASSKQTIVVLSSPSSIPSRPLDPRIFITHMSSPIHPTKEIVADFRWSPPSEVNGIVIHYYVSCWYIDNGTLITACDDLVSGKFLQYQANHLLSNQTYFFKVNAITAAGAGKSSDVVSAETSIERPVPQLLLAKADSVKVADLDAHEEKLFFSKATHPAAIAYLAEEKRVFWLEEEGALMVSSLNGANVSLIKHLSTEGTSLTVDWIGKHLYWAEVDKEGKSSVWSVDLSYNSQPRKMFERFSQIYNLEVEPFTGSLLWTRALKHNYDLMISDTSGSNVRPFFWQYEASTIRTKVKRNKQVNNMCNCSRSETVGPAITIDNTDPTKLKILWVDSFFGHIWFSDMEGCFCKILIHATENSGLPPTSLTVDSSRIYWLNKTLGKVYSINKNYTEEYSGSPVVEEILGIRNIRAIGHHLQPYPHVSCLIYESYYSPAQLIKKTSDSLTLYLPHVQRPQECNKMLSPSLLFTVYFGPTNEENTTKCFIRNEKNLCKNIKTYNNSIVIENLMPFTNYSIRVSVMNYYSKGLSTLGPEAVYATAVGTPSPPVQASAESVTPFRIDVSWLPPLLPNGEPIFYEIRWKTKNSTRDAISTIQSECGKDSNSNLSATILTSEAGKDHYIQVRAYSSDCEKFSDSEQIIAPAYPLPNNLTLVNASSSSLILTWLSPSDNSILKHTLQYIKDEDNTHNWNTFKGSHNDSTMPFILNVFLIQNLVPKTRYKFRLVLTYNEKYENFVWPQGFTFEYATSGDVPSAPGKPQVKHIGREVYQVVWTESFNNGNMDLSYELEIRSDDDKNWKSVTNTSISQWIINHFSGNTNYEFRVRAINEYGGSNFSFSEKHFYLPEAGALIDPADDPFGIIIASSVAIVILLAMFFSVIYFVHLKKEKEKKILLQETPSNLQPDLELATLEDLPLRANFVETNALYNLNDLPTDEELLALPQIYREQILVTKFLGSGAFGEVFEGIACGLSEHVPSLKIAIKTLKKGATDHEKDEFLKEATLMSNFKHDHILQLLGVCFDNNPNFICLELMEGGDLLSYLRSNRPGVIESSELTMDDLIAICIDVAEGCKYLEDMHFVHRDLAARNCLVSSHNRSERIVKIGDFGLARDIYKNDYYRKHGEGLLPVRWMAPESLLYGVFTSQSDVWAFGVLLWEIMTLGMQPYPARTNMEVLYYVRAGGLLDKPENCPAALHAVMLSCWSYDPDSRPTFYSSLNALIEIRTSLSSTSLMSAVFNFDYFGQENLGFDNLGYLGSSMSTSETSSKNATYSVATTGTYLERYEVEYSEGNKNLDENYDARSTQSDPTTSSEMFSEANTCIMRRSLSWTTLQTPENSTSALRMSAKVKCKQAANKYLELLGDNEDCDGYQLPLQIHKSHKQTSLRSEKSLHFVQASPLSSKKVIQPSLSLNYLPETLDFRGSCDQEYNTHLTIGDELEFPLEPKSGSPSTHSANSWLEDCDKWSFSTASTVTCQIDTATGSQENITSALSCIAGVDINYPGDSSYC